jgi:hypothetical protein
MLKRMFVKRGMTLRLNGKNPERKVRGTILFGDRDLFVNFLCVFHVYFDLLDLIQPRYLHKNLLYRQSKRWEDGVSIYMPSPSFSFFSERPWANPSPRLQQARLQMEGEPALQSF